MTRKLIAMFLLAVTLGGCHATRCGTLPWQQPCPIIDPYDPDPQP